MDTFQPLLGSHDWNEEWMRLQELRNRIDDAGFWDKRSLSYSTKDAPHTYVDDFLQRAQIKPGEEVFDMGCGPGVLALPLARKGHRVIAADFSQGMIERLVQSRKELELEQPITKVMSWEDDWEAHGVHRDAFDVCLASRSIAVLDMRRALLKLTYCARRRVCISVATAFSPRVDSSFLAEVGIENPYPSDASYAMNILFQMGIYPELSIIKSERSYTFNSFEEGLEIFGRMIDSTAAALPVSVIEQAHTQLTGWLEDHIRENPSVGKPDKKGQPQGSYCLDRPRRTDWAFISWEVTPKLKELLMCRFG